MATGQGTGKRLSAQDLTRIQTRYESGDSVRQIALDEGVQPASIWRRIRLEGWKDPGETRQEAVAEYRQEVKQSYLELAREHNGRHLAIFTGALAIGVGFLRELKDGGTVEKARPQQLESVLRSIKLCVDGSRTCLALDGRNIMDDDADANETATQRLLSILTPQPATTEEAQPPGPVDQEEYEPTEEQESELEPTKSKRVFLPGQHRVTWCN